MAIENYYVVLGVPRTETASGIRAAYRDLAKRFHPDLAGETGKRSFQKIAEAYRVLSDPEQRSAHDRDLERARATADAATVPVRVHVSTFDAPALRRPLAEPLRSHPETVEPLVGRRRWTTTSRDRRARAVWAELVRLV